MNYANAHEWLKNHIDSQPVNVDRSEYWRNLVMTLAKLVDADEIQDIFERDMDEDGFFDSDDSPGA